MDKLIAEAREEFDNVFGESASHYGVAPGRVEVLGNHTDYNDGFILAAAIDRRIAVVGRPLDGSLARIHSATFNSGASFDVDKPEKNPDTPWANYAIGVVWQLANIDVNVGGFEALIVGDVPLGAGLSSSAALELAVAKFLQAANGFAMEPIDMALNCQAAENNFVGVNCGILDQFTAAMGRKDRLVFLDCRNLSDYDYFPLSQGLDLVIADTRAPHTLVDGDYNRRRESCFRAAKACAALFPDKNITHLRDVDMDTLLAVKNVISEEDFRRARHIVTDNDRVKRGAAALTQGDAATMGAQMNESHASSRDDFANSSPELDIMVSIAQSLPGCHGARLNGGGFGGATINLVDTATAADFAAELNVRYFEKTGIQPEIHLFHAGGGAEGGKLAFES